MKNKLNVNLSKRLRTVKICPKVLFLNSKLTWLYLRRITGSMKFYSLNYKKKRQRPK